MSLVVPLLNVPCAVNCWVRPSATEAVAGDTWIEVNGGAVTVNVVEPVTTAPPSRVKLAEIVEEPWVLVVASPPATIEATDVVDEPHVTREVRSRVAPLLNVPCAVNCWVAPAVTDGLPGDTAMDVR